MLESLTDESHCLFYLIDDFNYINIGLWRTNDSWRFFYKYKKNIFLGSIKLSWLKMTRKYISKINLSLLVVLIAILTHCVSHKRIQKQINFIVPFYTTVFRGMLDVNRKRCDLIVFFYPCFIKQKCIPTITWDSHKNQDKRKLLVLFMGRTLGLRGLIIVSNIVLLSRLRPWID